MDEPTHTHESEFWDQVAEWLLGAPEFDPLPAHRSGTVLRPGPGAPPHGQE